MTNNDGPRRLAAERIKIPMNNPARIAKDTQGLLEYVNGNSCLVNLPIAHKTTLISNQNKNS